MLLRVRSEWRRMALASELASSGTSALQLG